MPPAPKTILIVDDEKPMAHALELKLNHSGFRATVVPDGQTALETLQKEKFDLMLLDLIMPNLDGFGVLQELSRRKNKTPVIVISNLSQAEDEERAKALGAREYLVKSNVPIAEIVNQIKRFLK